MASLDSYGGENYPYHLAGYYGRSTKNHLYEIVLEQKHELFDTEVFVLEAGKVFSKYWDFKFEWNVNLVQHKEHSFQSDFLGIAAFIAVRYEIPWSRVFNFSLAVGEGGSYNGRIPAVETFRKGQATSRYLNFLSFEGTVGLTQLPHWQATVRIYHRSGIFGLINGVKGGSNILGVGLKYIF